MLYCTLSFSVLVLLDATLVTSRAITPAQRPYTIDVVRRVREETPRLDKRGHGTVPSDNHPGFQWTAPLSIGNPPQKFDIEIDTGSGDFWVLGPSSVKTASPAYNPDLSNSWRNGTTGVATWHASYSGGAAASGYIGHDDVTIGPLKLIGTMLEVSRESTWGGPGLMGLAPTFADPKKCTLIILLVFILMLI